MTTGLTTEQRIKRAIIQLQKKNPFFTYLSLFLKFKEVPKEEMEMPTMGVDINANVYYVKEFVEGLTEEELLFVITHELFHIVFLSEIRQRGRDKSGWNCATDLAINTILKQNGFTPLQNVIIADSNDKFKAGNITIEKVSEKSAEEIYDLFPEIKRDKKVYVISSVKEEKGKELGEGFDNHLKSKGNKEGLSKKESKELEKKWTDRVTEALLQAEMKGDVPKGLERLIKNLHEEKVNWRNILNQFITNQIPYDYTYSNPSKKSVSTQIYMPNVLKEKIDIVLMVDLSGSIGNKEYADFISEVIGIAKAYQDRITIRVLSHDTECYDNGLIQNGNIEKIKTMELKGGGGTSFIRPLEFIKEENINPRLLLWMTDGYGDRVEKQPYPILWVLTKGGSDDYIKGSGEIIRLEE